MAEFSDSSRCPALSGWAEVCGFDTIALGQGVEPG